MKNKLLCLIIASIFGISLLVHSNGISSTNDVYLYELLTQGKYEKIEDILNKYHKSREKDSDGRRIIHSKMNELSLMSNNESFELKDCIDMHMKWVKLSPNSYFANASLGRAYVSYALNARKNRDSIAEKQIRIKLFKERLKLAEIYLVKAYELDPTNPVAPIDMIGVVIFDSVKSGKKAKVEKWFKIAISCDPSDLRAYRSKLKYLQPYWGGSHSKLLAFSRETLKNAPKDSMAPWILTKTHWDIYKDKNNTDYFKKPRVWKEMKETYNELEKRFPKSLKIHNWFARTACYAGDLETAKTQFSKIEEFKFLDIWKNREEYEYFKKLAFGDISEWEAMQKSNNNFLSLLKQRKYKKIEDILYKTLHSKERDASGRNLIHTKLDELAMSAGCKSTALKNCIDMHLKWLKHSPKSHFVHASLGHAYIKYAWNARGNGYADTVSSDGWKLFEERLKLAATYFEKAYELDPTDPAVALGMMTIANVSSGLPAGEEEKWFQRAIKADPLDTKSYYNKLQYLHPKWSGSFNGQLRFSRSSMKSAPKNSMVPIVLIESHWVIYKALNKIAYFQKPKVWKEMKETYIELENRFPESLKIPNLYAQNAYLAGDFEIAKTEFAKIGDDWDKHVWGIREKFDHYKKMTSIQSQ